MKEETQMRDEEEEEEGVISYYPMEDQSLCSIQGLEVVPWEDE